MADQLPDATKGVANYIDSYLDVLKSLLDSLDRSVLKMSPSCYLPLGRKTVA